MAPRRKYEDVDRAKMAFEYMGMGYAAFSRKYPGIPKSTVHDWALLIGQARPLRSPGRPTFLMPEEETELVKMVETARANGAPIDADSIRIMGMEASGRPNLQLTKGWVRL